MNFSWGDTIFLFHSSHGPIGQLVSFRSVSTRRCLLPGSVLFLVNYFRYCNWRLSIVSRLTGNLSNKQSGIGTAIVNIPLQKSVESAMYGVERAL